MAEKFCGKEEEKSAIEYILGTVAFNFLLSLASKNSLSDFNASIGDSVVQQGLSQIVEGSTWTYAIFWQVSKSKSGELGLIWGDGRCRETKNEENSEYRVSSLGENFGSVSGVGFLFNSGKTMWVSDENGSLDCYGFRLFLAKLAGLKTIVFVPVKSGVVELASLKMVQKIIVWFSWLGKIWLWVTVFIKACKDHVDILKNSITDEEANSKGWLGMRSDSSNADTVAHKHGVLDTRSFDLHIVLNV
ncbi:Transcription factor MYC/MYB N-terminal [Dillenia turbinata]|uniref:Transcription factor n=1 Tax=Dillenia turbinata TaxID=194707 RepID=A0AAN8ZKT8_9MAGN